MHKKKNLTEVFSISLILLVVIIGLPSSAVNGQTLTLQQLQQQIALLQQQLLNQQQNQKPVNNEDNSPIKVNGTGDPCQNTGNYLTSFNCGNIDNKTRHFTLIAQENVLVNITDQGQQFLAWAYNASIPGPTMRMTEGDNVAHRHKQRNKQTTPLFAYALNPPRRQWMA